jgi:hypothetical protein
MENHLRHLAVSIWLLLVSPAAFPADNSMPRNLQGFETAQKAGFDVYFKAYKRFGRIWRVSTALQKCELPGIMKAVQAKDETFTDALKYFTDNIDGSLDPEYQVPVALSTFMAHKTGYIMGYIDGSSTDYSDPMRKKDVCAVTLKIANEILASSVAPGE